MKNIIIYILTIVLTISIGFSTGLTLSISSIEDDSSGDIIFDIYMKNEVTVSAFQFHLTTDPSDILTFRSFCSYKNYWYENLSESDCYPNEWISVLPPDSGMADTSNYDLYISAEGNIYGINGSIDEGEGLLTRISAYYDITYINTPVIVSLSTPNCDPNDDGGFSIQDVILVNMVDEVGIENISENSYNCMNIAGNEDINESDVNVWKNFVNGALGYSFGSNINFLPQTWLVGTGIGIAGCMDETANNYNPNANIDDGSCSLANIKLMLPEEYQISTYPNPFNPTTTISFSIPEFGLTTITAYDITGRELETLTNTNLNRGNYSIDWNASSYPSGVYLIRMDSGDFTQTQKVVLVK